MALKLGAYFPPNLTSFVENAGDHAEEGNSIAKNQAEGKEAEQAGYYCRVCDIVYTSLESLKLHFKTSKHEVNCKSLAKKEDRYCYECDVECSDAGNLQNHKEGKKHQEKIGNCHVVNQFSKQRLKGGPVSSRIIRNLGALPASMLQQQNADGGSKGNELSNGPHRCLICQVKCSSAHDIKQHREGHKHWVNVARHENRYCELCECAAPNTDQYRIHVKGKRHTAAVEDRDAAKKKEQDKDNNNNNNKGGSSGHSEREKENLPPLTFEPRRLYPSSLSFSSSTLSTTASTDVTSSQQHMKQKQVGGGVLGMPAWQDIKPPSYTHSSTDITTKSNHTTTTKNNHLPSPNIWGGIPFLHDSSASSALPLSFSQPTLLSSSFSSLAFGGNGDNCIDNLTENYHAFNTGNLFSNSNPPPPAFSTTSFPSPASAGCPTGTTSTVVSPTTLAYLNEPPVSVEAFLQSVGLERYSSLFRQHEIEDVDTLHLLTPQHLQTMGLALGPCLKLSSALARLPRSA